MYITAHIFVNVNIYFGDLTDNLDFIYIYYDAAAVEMSFFP